MIDLHCHILPGVDDGPGERAESLALCRRAAADGCTAMVATPHLRHRRWWNDDRVALELALEDLRRELEGEIELFSGGEIALHGESYEEMLESLPGGSLLPLAGSHYLLLELDWRGLGPDPAEVVYEMRLKGYHSIIAHPERVDWLMEHPSLLDDLEGEGALFQVTAASVTGELGRVPQRAAQQLFEAGRVHFVASDAHGVERRPPGLAAARRTVLETWGAEAAHALFQGNPAAVLADRPLSAPLGVV
jgi:protein-tyrosine phosphatase